MGEEKKNKKLNTSGDFLKFKYNKELKNWLDAKKIMKNE